MPNKYFRNRYNIGMTLVELMVVISIFTLVTFATIFNYNTYRSSSSIQNLSDDIALAIRKAQSYAIGVYKTSSGFNYGYGISFSTQNNPSSLLMSSNKTFVLFTDVSDNKKYNYSSTSSICGEISSTNECTEIFNITTADEISEIYANDSLIGDSKMVDVYFKRPNPDAVFCVRNIGGSSCESNISNIKIVISSQEDNEENKSKSIKIWNTGQISVTSNE